MQMSRLFEIVYLLLERKKVTANELATHFEVSKRTILRDIETLSEAGIPVYALRGKGGGISILDNFVLNKSVITEKEQNQILFALKSLSATGLQDTGETLSRLEALFHRKNTGYDWLEVDFSRWGQGKGDSLRFETLRDAILGRAAIQFLYVNARGEKRERKAYPLKLVFKSKMWYIQCYCTKKQDYRTFKLTRMLRVELLDEHFSADAYTPPALEASPLSEDSLVSLELVFSPSMSYRVYDEFDDSLIRHSEDGTLHVAARMPEDSWLYSFLLSFGREVQVLQPRHVRKALAKLSKNK